MASPLTAFLPVIPGTNKDTILAALAGSKPALDTALALIGNVHYARILLLDTSVANLQPGNNPQPSYVLAIITEYDGPFAPYINDFASQVGGVFNVLLQFVVGGTELTPVIDNVQAFQEFVQKNDASQQAPNNNPFFEAYTATVQEILGALPS